ncbi:MAG TPA: hypothetical protein VGZ22_23205 [Isosphaeraceae bacterium]|jgi:hypothetical protein|nr:hypothetical protein [Isosphaeraceae bacterium]
MSLHNQAFLTKTGFGALFRGFRLRPQVRLWWLMGLVAGVALLLPGTIDAVRLWQATDPFERGRVEATIDLRRGRLGMKVQGTPDVPPEVMKRLYRRLNGVEVDWLDHRRVDANGLQFAAGYNQVMIPEVNKRFESMPFATDPPGLEREGRLAWAELRKACRTH